MFNESPIWSPTGMMWLRSFFIFFAVILVSAGVFLRIQYKNEAWPFEQKSQPVRVGGESGFEDILLRGDTAQLRVAYREHRDIEEKTFIERMEQLNKRLRLMQRMAVKNDELSEAGKEARVNLLQDMMLREFMNQQNSVYNPQHTTELRSEASAINEVSANELQEAADLATAVAAISQFLSSMPSQSEKFLTRAIDSVGRVSTSHPENEDIAGVIIQWLEMIVERKGVDTAEPVIAVLQKNYGETGSSRIRSMINGINEVAGAELFKLGVPSEFSIRQKDEVTAEVVEFIDAKQNQAQLKPLEIKSCIQLAYRLLMLGANDRYEEICQKLDGLTESDDGFKETMENYRKFTQLMSQPIDNAAFDNFEGVEVGFDENRFVKFRILVFVEGEKRVEAIDELNRMLPELVHHLRFKRLQLAVVYLDKGDQQATQFIQDFASKSPFPIWRLDVSTNQGTEFLKQVPIKSTPFSIMLDRNNKLVGVEPTSAIVEEQIFAEQ